MAALRPANKNTPASNPLSVNVRYDSPRLFFDALGPAALQLANFSNNFFHTGIFPDSGFTFSPALSPGSGVAVSLFSKEEV